MAGFADINASVNETLDSSQSENDETQIESQTERAPQSEAEPRQEQAITQDEKQAIAELERIERFKFQGKEYTPKELGALLAKEKEQEKAFTQKMQALSEERKQWESSRSANQKYDDNLVYDLEKVRQNPQLAQEFIRTYPESYHRHLKAVLSSTSSEPGEKQGTPHIPVELMSEVQRLSSYVQKQEVARAEVEIDRDLTKALSQFKYASRKEVLADVFEFHNSLPIDPVTGRKPPVPPEFWTKAAEASHNERTEWGKAYQKDLQQQQKQANSKARDVGSGGGTPGQAPKKFDPKKGFAALNRDVLKQYTDAD